MTIFYIVERGIKPLDCRGDNSLSYSYATLTLASEQVEELVPYLGQLLGNLSDTFPRIVKWNTRTHPITGGVTHKLRLNAQYRLDDPGFTESFVEVTEDGIPTKASILIPPFSKDHFWRLTAHHFTLAVFSQDPGLMAQRTCKTLKPYAHGFIGKMMSGICIQSPEWLFARAFDAFDILWTCGCWQFYGRISEIRAVIDALDKRNLVELGSQEELNKRLYQ